MKRRLCFPTLLSLAYAVAIGQAIPSEAFTILGTRLEGGSAPEPEA